MCPRGLAHLKRHGRKSPGFQAGEQRPSLEWPSGPAVVQKGHGFSRAVKIPEKRASAPEGWLSKAESELL